MNLEIKIWKYKTGNTNLEIQSERYIPEIQFGKYISGKYKSEDTNRKIQIGKYKSEHTIRKYRMRKIQIEIIQN